jgi:glycosyltransferase involved in cell wall biosynthesis
MIEHKVNGYLAKEKHDADLAEGILWCLENNIENHLGKSGREKVMKNYTFDAVSQQYKDLYESVLIS